jgi:thiol-disulfide isomerase/thioredoxin
MSVRLALATLLFTVGSWAFAADDSVKPIRGRILDTAGRPVPGVCVAWLWGANGLKWNQVVAVPHAAPEEIWRNEGKMEPWGDDYVETDADGRFSISARDRKNSLLACDRERRRGAILTFDPGCPDVDVEVRLRPLVRVFGTARLAGAPGPLEWCCVELDTPYDEKAPLLSRRIAICGTFRARFEFLIPPGTYEIAASSDSPRARTLEDRTITVTEDQRELDLGNLTLRPFVGLQDRIERAKERGTWGDYKENFGKRPPRWHITDSKGVAKNAQLSDFRDKWVVLYFWSPGCAPCLGKQLPELMAFYDAHRAQRDRFEILAFCCDFSETLKDIPQLEKRLEPVKKAVWGGRNLPFPVLLDNTFKTYEWYGLEGRGASNLLLISPEGKLVEGDLKTLAEKLERRRETLP